MASYRIFCTMTVTIRLVHWRFLTLIDTHLLGGFYTLISGGTVFNASTFIVKRIVNLCRFIIYLGLQSSYVFSKQI